MKKGGFFFVCRNCGTQTDSDSSFLNGDENLVCGKCYAANPPLDDVQDMFTETMMQMFVETKMQFTDEALKQHAAEVEGVCGACGGRTVNRRCVYDCR